MSKCSIVCFKWDLNTHDLTLANGQDLTGTSSQHESSTEDVSTLL